MSPSINEFEAKGWFLSQEGIDLIASENDTVSTLDDYITCAKDMDLRLLTTKGFNKTAEKPTEIPSPLVLQVLEVRNIAMPSVNQIENPRLLSITFTDGSKKKYKAVEVLGKVECIKLHTPPGTKFLVKKPIEIKDQILILGPDMLTELGGNVQELVQAWRAGKQFLKRYRGKSTTKDGDEESEHGPPAFVPFKVKTNTIDKEQKQKKSAESKEIAQIKNDKLVDKKGKKVRSENKPTESKKMGNNTENSESKKEQKKESHREKLDQKKDLLKEKREQSKDANSKAKNETRKDSSKPNTDIKKDKRRSKPEKLEESSNKFDKKDGPSENMPFENATNKPEKNERRDKTRKKVDKTVEQKENEGSLPLAKMKSRFRQTRDNNTESGTSSPTPHSNTATPPPEEKKSNRKKRSSKSAQQQEDKQESLPANPDQAIESKPAIQPKEKPARKKKPSTATKTEILKQDDESNLEEKDVESSTVSGNKKKPKKPIEKKIVSEETNDSDISKQSQKKSKTKSVNEKTSSTSEEKLIGFEKDKKKNSNSKPKRERKPRERGQRKDEQPKVSETKQLDSTDVKADNVLDAISEHNKSKKQPEIVSSSGSSPAARLNYDENTINAHSSNAAPNTSSVDQQYYNANVHQMQQPPPEYYYHQQPAYTPVVDYNMMVPIDPNTGLPAVMYGYHPDPHHQQQQYMQPMYYMTGQPQQPQQPYYNHQPHYTQLYDQDHYDHHNQYRQQQQQQQQQQQHSSNSSSNTGRGGSNSSRGRGTRGRGRGGFK